jgi:hypothetical protein
MSKIINLAELQQYIASFEPVKVKDYRISIEIQDESDFSFSVQLKLKEKDKGQEKLIKFRIALEQHETHEFDIPQFQIDYYRREEQKGSRIYFNLNIKDKEHLLDCIKGTLVILKEFLEQFGKKINFPELVNKILYKEAIELELLKYKPILIQVLYESFLNEQLVIRVDNERHVVKTLHNFEKYLNIEEVKPLYLPLLKKIKNK